MSLAKAWIRSAFVGPTARWPGPRFASAIVATRLRVTACAVGGEPEHREGAHARGVVVCLLELREPQLDEPSDLVVDPGLLLDQVHRKPRGLAELRTGQRFADPWLIGHPQGSEGMRPPGRS